MKFYLAVPDLTLDPKECFVGPQTRDRLHLKLARLRDHQLPLAGHAAAAVVLADWQPLLSAALIRGRLFYPASKGGVDRRALWCPADHAGEQLPDADSYALLSRREWFAPVDASLDRLDPWSRERVCTWAGEVAATWPAAAR